MVLRELPGWPPEWNGVYREQFEFPQGEIGTLRAAIADAEERAVLLVIELDGDHAIDWLRLPPGLLEPVKRQLQPCLGLAVSLIGSLPADGLGSPRAGTS